MHSILIGKIAEAFGCVIHGAIGTFSVNVPAVIGGTNAPFLYVGVGKNEDTIEFYSKVEANHVAYDDYYISTFADDKIIESTQKLYDMTTPYVTKYIVGMMENIFQVYTEIGRPNPYESNGN